LALRGRSADQPNEGILSIERLQPRMDRQKVIAVFFVLLMVMWLVAAAATVI